ncbi:hypothetical protein BGZ60DRAFT_533437 [Tricladium varicosporioides]|nr:hypothetical protein BGZ60DRAFT_533437 [Hymenoscyphus varicosporioides]
MTIGESSGGWARKCAVSPSVEASFGGSVLGQDALGWEISNSQFEVIDSSAINLSSFCGSIEVHSYFEDPGAGLVFKNRDIYNTGQHEEAFTRLTRNAEQNRADNSSPAITYINSEDGNMHASECESVFDSSQREQTRSCSRSSTPEFLAASNPAHDVNPQTEDDDSNSNDDEDELLRSQA